MNDQREIAVLAVHITGQIATASGDGVIGPPDDVANALADLRRKLSAESEHRDLFQSGGTMLLGFDGADDAFRAACVMQQGMSKDSTGTHHLHFRSLLSLLPTTEAASGTAAAVLDGLHRLPVKGLFANRTFVDALSPSLSPQFRLADIDGNDTLCGVLGSQLYESLYIEQECTAVAIPAVRHADAPRNNALSLRWRDQHLRLDPESSPITLGRGSAVSVQIRTDYASRTHARIAFEKTNFVLHDDSTNGTYLCMDDESEIFVHHEQIVLRGQGAISLGRTTHNSATHLIYFKCSSCP